jgi:DNA-binding transcriptional LysR family regulator
MADAFPDVHSRHLRAVLAVAEYRSFVAAAAGLKVSQPALTRTIKQLEVKLGVLLFTRSTREVAATDAGKEFAALAERLINDLKIGIESVRERASEQRGQIVVASVISLASLVSPRLIADFARRFGGVEIHLREGLQSSVRDDVRSGVADFGVGFVDRLPRLFATERLGQERFHAVLPAGHALAAQREIRLRALEDVPLVSLPAETRSANCSTRRPPRRGSRSAMPRPQTVCRLSTVWWATVSDWRYWRRANAREAKTRPSYRARSAIRASLPKSASSGCASAI